MVWWLRGQSTRLHPRTGIKTQITVIISIIIVIVVVITIVIIFNSSFLSSLIRPCIRYEGSRTNRKLLRICSTRKGTCHPRHSLPGRWHPAFGMTVLNPPRTIVFEAFPTGLVWEVGEWNWVVNWRILFVWNLTHEDLPLPDHELQKYWGPKLFHSRVVCGVVGCMICLWTNS